MPRGVTNHGPTAAATKRLMQIAHKVDRTKARADTAVRAWKDAKNEYSRALADLHANNR